MIRKLVSFALSQRFATLSLVMAIIITGIWAWSTLKKEAYPDVGDTTVTVITQYPGRAAEEIEQQITLPIERALYGVPKVLTSRSKSIFGLSVIQVTFEDGVDDYFARQQVIQKLGDAVLPDGVNPSLGPLTGPVDEIFRYIIEAPTNYTPMDLRTLQDWVIVPRLLQVPGIADVVNFGGLVKQFHVITSPEKLIRYSLNIQTVINAIMQNNVNTGGNIINRGGQGFVVRGIGAIRSKDDIGNIVVSSNKGVPVFVKNIASIEEFPLPPTGVLGYATKSEEGKVIDVNSSIQGLIAMRRGENPSNVIEALKEKINDINASDLPEGVHLKITYDRSLLVNYTIDTVSTTLFEGFSIVIIVLIFFMGSVRSALVVATTIPISMLFAFVMMKITGIPANLLSLGAIDFGIIVDGAVVMVENIMRRYRDATPEEMKVGIIRYTLSATQEVGREIFFSITIIILAYIPIFSFQRVEGKLFSPMAYTLAFAITGSMLLALTAIPVLMTFMYKKYFDFPNPKKLEWHNPIFGWIQKNFDSAITILHKHNVKTICIAFGFVIIVVFIGFKSIGTEFLPELDEGAFNIRCFFPVGISLRESSKYDNLIRNIIMKYDPVNLVITQQGRNDDGTDPYGPNRLEILVGLKKYSFWTNKISKADLLKKMNNDLQTSIPGAQFSFSQPILDNVTEAVTGSVADLAILINGEDLKLMRAKADSILQIIRTIPGASESGIEQEGDQAQLSITVNREAAARFGVNVSDIQGMIEAAIGGKSISKLYDGSKRFDIVVRYSSEYRSSVESIKNMQLLTSSGTRIALSQLASINLIDGSTIIQREGGKRQISVRTNIRGRDQGSFASEAQKLINEKIKLPKGYSIELGGQFENLSRASKQLAIVIPVTILIIFLVLFSMFKNIKHVIIAMSSIPFALVGGILALLIRGYSFNVSAGVGFISLFGVSIMVGVLYISRTNNLINDSGLELKDAVCKAASIQLRPSLMTMIPAFLGLLPAARASGIGSDVQRPLATVIVGGLFSALLLTLFVLPSLYFVLEGLLKKKK